MSVRVLDHPPPSPWHRHVDRLRDTLRRVARHVLPRRFADHRDPLTGVAGRVALIDRLNRALAGDGTTAAGFVLVAVELHGFSRVNARFGDQGGDVVLRQVANRLRSAARPSDLVARTGGDRFAIFIDDGRRRVSVAQVAERIARVLAAPYRVSGQDVVVTAGIGVAAADTRYRRAGEVLRDADTAAARVATGSPAGYALFDPAMRDRAAARLQLEQELRRAVEHGEFELHYQPIVATRSSDTVGFEALLRWRHPEHGLLAPARFMDVLHETKLILPVGEWVRAEACRQYAEWARLGLDAAPISVNVTPIELLQPGFAERTAHTIAAAGLRPDALAVEITEEALIGDTQRATAAVAALRARGIRVLIDDFGSGYSSLAYLRELPVDGLKVDRSFIRGVDRAGRAREILRAIIGLAHVLDLGVTGEGVETAAQHQALRELGCDAFQGFFASKPVGGAAAPLVRVRARHSA